SLVRPRAKTFAEAAEQIKPLLKKPTPSQDLLCKTFNDQNLMHLSALSNMLKSLDQWDEDGLKLNVKDWLAKNNLSLKDIGGGLRVALLGQSNSPELFQV